MEAQAHGLEPAGAEARDDKADSGDADGIPQDGQGAAGRHQGRRRLCRRRAEGRAAHGAYRGEPTGGDAGCRLCGCVTLGHGGDGCRIRGAFHLCLLHPQAHAGEAEAPARDPAGPPGLPGRVPGNLEENRGGIRHRQLRRLDLPAPPAHVLALDFHRRRILLPLAGRPVAQRRRRTLRV